MGLLDDAIREHLELKRRRGADPGEIAREESEALGPVRREPVEPAAAPGPHTDEGVGLESPGEAYAGEPSPYDDPRDHPHLDEPPTAHEAPYAEEESESATPPHGDPYQSTREFSAEELDAALGGERGAAGGQDVGAVSAGAAEEAAQPGAEGEGEHGDEDVLEETPDFLQETPEHDRLWFEQKPPKDFDF